MRKGKVGWSYDDPPGKGEISDAVMLSNGHVLFVHQFGVTEITPNKKVVWNYDTPAGHQVHTAMPIGKNGVHISQGTAQQEKMPVADTPVSRRLKELYTSQ